MLGKKAPFESIACLNKYALNSGFFFKDIARKVCQLRVKKLHKEQSVQVSDTTSDAQKHTAGNQNIFLTKVYWHRYALPNVPAKWLTAYLLT